jgi:hypothetical protein
MALDCHVWPGFFDEALNLCLGVQSQNGEIRESGTGWNVLKNFAILRTIVMAVATFSALSAMSNVTSNLRSDAERSAVVLPDRSEE